jgi:hypothetical protein
VQEPRGVRRAGGVAASLIVALVLVELSALPVRAEDGFEIAGEVVGLYPGAHATLDAQVTNPHPFAIRVITTTVTVLDAGPACPASMLEIGDSQASVEIPPRETGTVPLDVRMSRGAPNACQGATWPLQFTGTAVGTGSSGLPGTSMIDPRSLSALVTIGAALLAIGIVAVGRDRRGRGSRAL